MKPERQTDAVRETFSDWCRRGRAEGMEDDHAPAARVAFERLRLATGGRFLDVGCGNGYAVRWAAAAAPTGLAVGVDLSEDMIEHARGLAKDVSNAHFVAGSITDLPREVLFPAAESPEAGSPEAGDDRSFDAIFSMEALYYVPELDRTLGRIRDLLRPGGRFSSTINFYDENAASRSWPTDVGIHMNRLTAAAWKDAFARAGFDHAKANFQAIPEPLPQNAGIFEGV